MNGAKTLIFFMVLSAVLPVGAFSFSFQPLSADFAAAGPGSIQTFRIENDTDKPIAVKISIQTREMLYDGSEENGDASDLFLVYPPQVYLEPGLYQAVRVQWTGPESVEKERAFRIIAEQLPVETEASTGSGGSINIMLRYKGAIYVLPENPVTRIEFLHAEPADAGPDGKGLAVELMNRGNTHAILQDLTMTLQSGEEGTQPEEVLLEGPALEGMTGENILAGLVRRFIIPWPPGLGEGNISAELSFKPVR